jgi:hypothetical protein
MQSVSLTQTSLHCKFQENPNNSLSQILLQLEKGLIKEGKLRMFVSSQFPLHPTFYKGHIFGKFRYDIIFLCPKRNFWWKRSKDVNR